MQNPQQPAHSARQQPPHLVRSSFQKGVSPNPGGKLPSAAYRKVYADLVAELGGQVTASQALLIDEIAKAKTGRLHKSPAATVGRLMRQLGLPAKKVEQPDKPSLHEHLARRGP